MHSLYSKNGSRLLVVMLAMFIGGCDGLQHERECKTIAGTEIFDERLWDQYLTERKIHFTKIHLTVDGEEIDPNYYGGFPFTDNFSLTNQWVLNGKPERPLDVIYRNDSIIYEKNSGTRVAQLFDVTLSRDTWNAVITDTCLGEFPYLYTGAEPKRGNYSAIARRNWPED